MAFGCCPIAFCLRDMAKATLSPANRVQMRC
jgi:hypothetical protein